MYSTIMVKREHKVVPLTPGELDNMMRSTIVQQITVLEQKFGRARNRMIKLGYRNQIQELHSKLNTIHEGY